MNCTALRNKMDRFFKNVSVEKLEGDLKKMGYKIVNTNFIESDDKTLLNIPVNELLNIPGMSFGDDGENSYPVAA